jgi:hypothetical protein
MADREDYILEDEYFDMEAFDLDGEQGEFPPARVAYRPVQPSSTKNMGGSKRVSKKGARPSTDPHASGKREDRGKKVGQEMAGASSSGHKCRTCGGTYPICGCNKRRKGGAKIGKQGPSWKAKAIGESLANSRDESSIAADAAALRERDSNERVEDLQAQLDEALSMMIEIDDKSKAELDKTEAANRKVQAWRDKLALRMGAGYSWETGSNSPQLWWSIVRLGMLINRIPGVAWWKGFGTPLRNPIDDLCYKQSQEMIQKGVDTTAFNLTFGSLLEPLVNDERAEVQTLRDIKYDWALCRCTLTFENRMFSGSRDIDISLELLMNLTTLATWDRSMSAEQIRDRMVLSSKSFHHLNTSRSVLHEAVMQNTIMLAVGWTLAMRQSVPELDFCLTGKGSGSSATVTGQLTPPSRG